MKLYFLYICTAYFKKTTAMKIRIILILPIAVWATCVGMYAQINPNNSGLFFASHEVILDKRTSLCLTPGHPFTFDKSFAVEFDAKFRQGDGYYGVICRLIGNGTTNIDLISNLASETANFWLVVKDTIPFSYKLSEIPRCGFGSWTKIRIAFDLKKSEITLSINGCKKEKVVKGISSLHDFDMIFGACKNARFLNTDVSPMTLRDVVILNHQNKVLREWKLSKHALNAVYDEVKGDKATVYNGEWIADKSVRWEKLRSLKVTGLIGVAKNEQEGVYYLIGRRYMLAYSAPSNRIDTIRYFTGCPYNNYYNYFVYNKPVNQIWSYDVGNKVINIFDFQKRSWSQSGFDYKEPDVAHHNKIISPVNGNLVTFGGYGHYRYKSQVNIFDQKQNGWKRVDVSNEIAPRYLSAAGLSENNQLLVFGGYGSKSGRQEVSPEFFYDLYAIDLKNYQVKKLCQYATPDIPYVPCEALIKKPHSDCFYTLLYNSGHFTSCLRLAEFRTDKSEYVVYPDSIPYNFSDIESWCTFFLYDKTSTIFALTVHKTDVEIYSLAYPPLLRSEVIQPVPGNDLVIWIIGLVVALGGLAFVYIRFVRKKPKLEEPEPYLPFAVESDSQNIATFDVPLRTSKSSIYLLGGFQVFDMNGMDITASFTPTLKQLFIIVFLYTVKTGRGISTAKLNEILWFDKSETSARNNRNVSISKLRGLLNKIGEIDLEQENTYWRIRMEGVYSDFVEITSLSKKFGTPGVIPTEAEILRFVHVAFPGELLPDVQIDWMDEFKADFLNTVLDRLGSFTELEQVKKNDHLLTYIADCILRYDAINEEAIALKCSVLYKLGKKGLAKNAYDSFSREYKNLLGSDYPVRFNDLLGLKG
jgi:two-component SAPR family response regulator